MLFKSSFLLLFVASSSVVTAAPYPKSNVSLERYKKTSTAFQSSPGTPDRSAKSQKGGSGTTSQVSKSEGEATVSPKKDTKTLSTEELLALFKDDKPKLRVAEYNEDLLKDDRDRDRRRPHVPPLPF